MTMRCSDCRESLNAYLDQQLSADRVRDVREHLASCTNCTREYDALSALSHSLKEGLVRYAAPSGLEDRIRDAIGRDTSDLAGSPPRRPWTALVAAGLAVAIASSALTMILARPHAPTSTVADQVVASHIRSLMPGHLTDVASTNLHNVKPWFAGRVALSPTVPNLDSAGFPLAGGRLDYVDGKTVAALVYMRRQHVINVYTWPERGADVSARREPDAQGYHLAYWRHAGVESWVISDVDPQELERFVGLFK